jgi:antitoxin Xre/MbcA/ParS-like protein
MGAFRTVTSPAENETLPNLSDPEVRARLSPTAIKALLRLAEAWQLRDESTRQLLGGVSHGYFYELKAGKKKTLNQDQLTRISLLLGIYTALNVLYSKELASRWVKLPNSNPMFAGTTPLEYLVEGGVPALVRVRQLVDARASGF